MASGTTHSPEFEAEEMRTRGNTFKANVREELICGICLDFLDEPKLLECAHSFCLACLQQMVQDGELQGDELECPSCTQATKLPSGNVDDLKTNHALKRLVSIVNADDKKVIRERLHSRRMTNNALRRSKFQCPHHLKPAERFCLDCNELLCVECTSFTHSGHSTDYARNVVPQQIQGLRNLIQPACEIVEKAEEVMKKLTMENEIVTENIHTTTDEIQAFFTNIRKSLDKRESALKNTVRMYADIRQSMLDSHYQSLQSHHDAILDKVLELEKLIEDNVIPKLLAQKRTLVEDLEAQEQSILAISDLVEETCIQSTLTFEGEENDSFSTVGDLVEVQQDPSSQLFYRHHLVVSEEDDPYFSVPPKYVDQECSSPQKQVRVDESNTNEPEEEPSCEQPNIPEEESSSCEEPNIPEENSSCEHPPNEQARPPVPTRRTSREEFAPHVPVRRTSKLGFEFTPHAPVNRASSLDSAPHAPVRKTSRQEFTHHVPAFAPKLQKSSRTKQKTFGSFRLQSGQFPQRLHTASLSTIEESPFIQSRCKTGRIKSLPGMDSFDYDLPDLKSDSEENRVSVFDYEDIDTWTPQSETQDISILNDQPKRKRSSTLPANLKYMYTALPEYEQTSTVLTPIKIIDSKMMSASLAEQKIYPNGICCCTEFNDRLIVTDVFNHCLRVLDNSGNFIEKIGKEGRSGGQFKEPSAVAIDSDSNLFVTERDNPRVQKFTATGTYVTKFGQKKLLSSGLLGDPIGIAITRNNSALIADWERNNISIFTNKGRFVNAVEIEQNSLQFPGGLTVNDNNNVLITDRRNHCVWEVNINGEIVQKIGSEGELPGELYFPYGVIVLRNKAILVSESGNNRISMFSESGEFIRCFGEKGSGPGQFDHPRCMCENSSGEVVIVDQMNQRLQVFRID